MSEEETSINEISNPTPVSVVWKNLSLKVDIKKFFRVKSTLTVLNNLNGAVHPGQLLAVMGSSGSGKTSFLNTLAGRIFEGTISGDIYLQKEETTPEGKTRKVAAYSSDRLMKNIAGYVPQEDHLLENLTVRETLTYAARLRLPSTMSNDEKLEQVERVIQELRLTHVADSKVGGEFVRGISGGEKRRVSIGLQLLTNPSVLFLDEPTSGLDSTTAHNVIDTLLKLARRNRTVICTIHQPRSDIFAMFDQVMLLSRGEMAYFGDASTMVSHFANVGFECPIYSNPADFAVDLINVDLKNEETEKATRARLMTLVDAYKNEQTAISKDRSNTIVEKEEEEEEQEMLTLNNSETPSFVSSKQFLFEEHRRKAPTLPASLILFQRSMKNLVRTSQNMSARTFNLAAMSFLLFIFIFRMRADQYGAQNRVGLLYEGLTGAYYVGHLNSVALFPIEKFVFHMEHIEGAYSTTAFFIAYSLIKMIFDIIAVIIFSGLFYWAIGFVVAADKFFMFMCVEFCLILMGESLGCFFCCLFKDANVANQFGSTTATFFMMMAGFFRSAAGFPVIFTYINYISPIRYGGSVLLTNELEDLTFSCKPDQTLPDGTCKIKNGMQILDNLSVNPDHLYRNVGLMIMMSVIYFLLFYVTLNLTVPRPKKQHNVNQAVK